MVNIIKFHSKIKITAFIIISYFGIATIGYCQNSDAIYLLEELKHELFKDTITKTKLSNLISKDIKILDTDINYLVSLYQPKLLKVDSIVYKLLFLCHNNHLNTVNHYYNLKLELFKKDFSNLWRLNPRPELVEEQFDILFALEQLIKSINLQKYNTKEKYSNYKKEFQKSYDLIYGKRDSSFIINAFLIDHVNEYTHNLRVTRPFYGTHLSFTEFTPFMREMGSMFYYDLSIFNFIEARDRQYLYSKEFILTHFWFWYENPKYDVQRIFLEKFDNYIKFKNLPFIFGSIKKFNNKKLLIALTSELIYNKELKKFMYNKSYGQELNEDFMEKLIFKSEDKSIIKQKLLSEIKKDKKVLKKEALKHLIHFPDAEVISFLDNKIKKAKYTNDDKEHLKEMLILLVNKSSLSEPQKQNYLLQYQ